MIRKIVQKENPILRQKALEVEKNHITSYEIQNLITSMIETMRAAPGVGLAAPQIGVALQVVVIEDKEEYFIDMLSEIKVERGRKPIPLHVMINPKVTFLVNEKTYFFEGCLSVNGCSRITPRVKKIKVEYFNEKGEHKEVIADGWYARIIQHETDHLKGILFTDISNNKSEISNTTENRNKWLNAKAVDIEKYLKICES